MFDTAFNDTFLYISERLNPKRNTIWALFCFVFILPEMKNSVSLTSHCVSTFICSLLLCCGNLTCEWLIDGGADTAWCLTYNDKCSAAASRQRSLGANTAIHTSITPVCFYPKQVSSPSNFSHGLPVNHKINWAFFSLRLLKTNQLRAIHCNKDVSALDEADEILGVIWFSCEGKRGSADRAKAFVFIEWLLCEVHPA